MHTGPWEQTKTSGAQYRSSLSAYPTHADYIRYEFAEHSPESGFHLMPRRWWRGRNVHTNKIGFFPRQWTPIVDSWELSLCGDVHCCNVIPAYLFPVNFPMIHEDFSVFTAICRIPSNIYSPNCVHNSSDLCNLQNNFQKLPWRMTSSLKLRSPHWPSLVSVSYFL